VPEAVSDGAVAVLPGDAMATMKTDTTAPPFKVAASWNGTGLSSLPVWSGMNLKVLDPCSQ
jgi:hypothetical protein